MRSSKGCQVPSALAHTCPNTQSITGGLEPQPLLPLPPSLVTLSKSHPHTAPSSSHKRAGPRWSAAWNPATGRGGKSWHSRLSLETEQIQCWSVIGDHLKLCINGNLTEMAQDLKSVLALSALCQPVIQWGEPSWGPSN